MGGSSTSHSAVLRGHKDTKSSGLNLHSWQGLTEVLRAGKSALHDAGAYADFRNLVLEYAQKGGDVELRKKIDAIVATFNVVASPREEVPVPTPPVPNEVKAETKVEPEVEQKEIHIPVPVVHAEPNTQAVTDEIPAEKVQVAPTPLTSIPLEPTPITPPPTPSSAPIPASTSTGLPMGTRRMIPSFVKTPFPPSIQSSTPTSTPSEKKQDEPTPVTPPITVVETPVEKLVEDSREINPPQPVVTQKGTIDEYKARITEIKHQVHEHIGNPAALMDSQNDLGKKYMTALLSALKATGSGQSAHTEMATLEGVVAQLLERGGQKSETRLPDLPPTFVPVVEEVPIVEEEVPNVEEKKVPEVEIEKEEIVQIPVTPAMPVEEPYVEPVVEKPKPVMVKHVMPEIRQRTTEVNDVLPRSQNVSEEDSEKIVEVKKEEVAVPVKVESSTPPTQPTPPTPPERPAPPTMPDTPLPKAPPREVHEDVPPSTPQPLIPPLAESYSGPLPQTELSTPEITASLHQLLHEWSIFAGSGLFGIGPGGADHPLYKIIAPLSMGEVVAGRWEGADPKVVKTIKQYVDAWRHEQGVAYTITETFEHYLRRVVQRIVKRQAG